ncbi:PH domain-containing protein [Promicromonospora vindobonensis]|uniref:PH domain-containing protein n=1 Tax=Promicromonospora vindobonensis TaxID=195748 RepID=A0ABW5VU34_9MICO
MSAELPAAGDPGAERLADAAVRYWNLRSLIGGVFFLAACAGALLIFRAEWMFFWGPWVVAPVVVLGVLIDVLMANRVQFRNYSFTVTPEFVYVARGRLFRRSATIPTAQILNVETVQGPLLASMGLVTVRFTCLLEVDGVGPLTPDRAEHIRRAVLDRGADSRVAA